MHQLFAICTELPRAFRRTSRAFFRGTTGILCISPMWQVVFPRLLPHNCPYSLASPAPALGSHSLSLSRSFGCHSNCNISLCFRHFVVCRRRCCLANSITQSLRVCECLTVCSSVCVCVSANAIEVWRAHTFITHLYAHTCAYSVTLLTCCSHISPARHASPLPCH